MAIARWPRRRSALPPSEPAAEAMVHAVHLGRPKRDQAVGSRASQSLFRPRAPAARDQLSRRDPRTSASAKREFTDHGFELNGKVIKLRGLDRHQTFPFVGPGHAGPRPAQRRQHPAQQAALQHRAHLALSAIAPFPRRLRRDRPAGARRNSRLAAHRRSSLEGISVDNVGRMIRRDWNHPSIILWGVRINESKDDHDFYTRTNALAHKLDPTRQTGGIRYFQESEFLEDVFTMNDFGFPLKPPNHPRYLNTEFVGHTYPTKTIDQVERLHRTHAAPRAHPRPAGLQSAIRRRHRLVRLRLQHARRLRLRRPHLLSRRHRHVPRTQARRRFLQIAMRSRRRSRAGAGLSLGARR